MVTQDKETSLNNQKKLSWKGRGGGGITSARPRKMETKHQISWSGAGKPVSKWGRAKAVSKEKDFAEERGQPKGEIKAGRQRGSAANEKCATILRKTSESRRVLNRIGKGGRPSPSNSSRGMKGKRGSTAKEGVACTTSGYVTLGREIEPSQENKRKKIIGWKTSKEHTNQGGERVERSHIREPELST